jgi:hypothetical protein
MGTRLLLAVLAIATLAVATGSSAASRLRVSETQFRMNYREMIIGQSGTDLTRCPVTLDGSFHATTFAKVAGSTVARIRRAAFGTCTNTQVTPLTETLPWTIRYQSFMGILPAITDLNMRIVGLTLRRPEMPLCLLTATERSPAGILMERERGGAISIKSDEIVLPTCGYFYGIAPITTPAGTAVTLSLI